MKKLIVLLFIIVSKLTLGQTTDERISKFNYLDKNHLIDSAFVYIHAFKDQFNIIKGYEILPVYADTIVDTLGNQFIGKRCMKVYSPYDSDKTGKWTEYYPNGTIKSTGEYSIGATTYCQAVGPIFWGYYFKSDMWKFYYPNGQLKAEGVFKLEVREFSNNCSGDGYFVPKVDDTWKFYDENGSIITPTPTLISEIEKH